MSLQTVSRRKFIQSTVAIATAFSAMTNNGFCSNGENLHISSNEYSWKVFLNRDKIDLFKSLDENLKTVAKSGMNGFEPFASSPEDIDRIYPALQKNGLEMRSLYVNSLLHEKDKAEQSIEQIVKTAHRAKDVGTKIIVTNPQPLSWGDHGKHKTDEQLIIQAESMNTLGAKLNELGIDLAFHNHTPEMLQSAREFHHMMVGTDPRYVKLCLDSHWVYRGAGNSQVALFDIVELYGERIVELHLRQSQNGIWSETFAEGDIDYNRLASKFLVCQAWRKSRRCKSSPGPDGGNW
jgi:inosose dehydratase